MKLKTLAQVSAIAALAGIGMPAFAQQTVTWWDFLAGGDGVRKKSLIEQFN